MDDCKKPYENSITITVIGKEPSFKFNCGGDRSLMEELLRQEIYISSVCGGRGTCGKCRIRVTSGNLKITKPDQSVFTEQELEQGWRLACKAYPEEDCTIHIGEEERGFEVVTENQVLSKASSSSRSKEEGYIIGIDIGTTTLAFSLVEIPGKDSCRTYTSINRQRIYGADVISRIQASNDGKKDELQKSIQRELLQGIRNVIEEEKLPENWLKAIAIAGNATMIHLLMGYSCETLGSYPYTPVNINTIELSSKEVLGDGYPDVPVVILPGISTFVGGDIVAGLLACDFDRSAKSCLFIDLGTNGEIALGNKDRILVSSTAAGPAFEGGNISCGTGSIPGAICNLRIENEKADIRTIGDAAPVGICGTGVLELTSELLKEGLMDETGLLVQRHFEEGYEVTKDIRGNAIRFTQKDIREVQLAKAAIRAGIEILLREYGTGYEDIDIVYLAGGFGYKLDRDKAVHIGLLPKELSGKIKAVGNSSLGGAIRYLTDNLSHRRVDNIIKVSQEIHLSAHKDFQELYLKHMNFNTTECSS